MLKLGVLGSGSGGNSLVLVDGDRFEKYAGAGAIKQYLADRPVA